jgi:hypothetical protein
LSFGALLALLPPLEPPLADAFSLAAPQADRARVPATATVATAARVVVLSFNWVPFDRSPDVGAGQTRSDVQRR